MYMSAHGFIYVVFVSSPKQGKENNLDNLLKMAMVRHEYHAQKKSLKKIMDIVALHLTR